MKHLYVIFVFLGILLSGCKSDKPKDVNNSETKNQTENPDEDEVLLSSIQNSYNIQRFENENQVKFNVALKVSDTLFYKGYMIINTQSKQIRLLNSDTDTLLNVQYLESDYHKTLFWVAENYALPFWLKPENFQKLSSNDSLTVSTYKSDLTNTEFKVSTHPLTHIINQVEYNTDIDLKPFNKGNLNFERYITVNRIPVAMTWNIKVEETLMGEIEISRISYPN